MKSKLALTILFLLSSYSLEKNQYSVLEIQQDSFEKKQYSALEIETFGIPRDPVLEDSAGGCQRVCNPSRPKPPFTGVYG